MNSSSLENTKQGFEGLEARFMEGEKEKVKKILMARLKSEGWVDQMKVLARKTIHKQGIENSTVDSIYEDMKTEARTSVPNVAKAEVYELVKKWIEEETNIDL